jgi:hypothetical protein
VGSKPAYVRDVGSVRVWRCTEAIDPKAGYIFRTIGDGGRALRRDRHPRASSF